MPETAEQDDDPRFTAGLLYDVTKVLEEHGYKAHPDCSAKALVALLGFVRAFEGKEQEG